MRRKESENDILWDSDTMLQGYLHYPAVIMTLSRPDTVTLFLS